MGTHPIFESDFDCLTELKPKMESNRDGAEQCLAKAFAALKQGDVEKARRMTSKSIRMFETEKVVTLLKQLNDIIDQPKDAPTKEAPKTETRKRAKVKEEAPKEYTQDQVEAVNKIMKAKSDYYKVLGLEKGATPAEVKKAYRKSALRLHPDKNSAPRADEAFKIVNKAFSILTDEDKRAHYERYGAEGPQIQNRPSHHHRRQGGHFDEDDMSAEDIFNMFFGGMPTAHRRRHNHQHRTFHFGGNHQQQQRGTDHQQTMNNVNVWLQFMPLLILIGLSLVSNLMTPDPLYTLSRQGQRGYTKHLMTETDRISYYVQPKQFELDFPKGPKERKKVERNVKQDYLEVLRNNCYQETLNSEHKMRRAQLYGDRNAMQQAQNAPRPNCKKLDDLTNGGQGSATGG